MDISNQSTPPVKKKINKKQAIKEAQEKASKLQSHRKTDYLPMKDQLSGIFSELVQLRKEIKQQLRKEEEVKKHLAAIILDLWVAANYSELPWRRVSLNRNDYSKNKRYSEKFLTYDLLDGVLINLELLKYIKKSDYFHDKESKKDSRQTRIKATDKLLNILNFDISKIDRNPEVPEEEVIIKRGEGKDKKNIEYVDDIYKIQMRKDLHKYNELLRRTSFGMDGIDLRYKYDTANITIKRIFNGEAGGGRYYYGFWENMSEKDRSRLKINNEAVCELDYANFQPTIAYAMKGIQVTNDLYTIEGCSRSEVKKAFLVLFNCKSRKHAIDTIRSKLHIKNAETLLQKIENKHEAIKNYFYNPGFGLHLQNLDSWIAENIINPLTEKGIVCLPIHDSFIVAKKYESKLKALMENVFQEKLNFKPIIK